MPHITHTDFLDLLRISARVTSVLDTVAYHEPTADDLEDHTGQTLWLIMYANMISTQIKEKAFRGSEGLPFIVFATTDNYSPEDHPTSTDARPDIVVYFDPKPGLLVEETIGPVKVPYWAQMESLGEVHSSSTSQPDSLSQVVTNTSYLLQARPDRTTLLTFWVGTSGMSFTLADVTGCKQTNVIGFHGTDGQSLHEVFCAFVYRLYLPHSYMFDPTIDRAGIEYFPAKNGNEGSRSSFLFYVDPPTDKSGNSTGPVVKPKSPRARYQILHVGHPTGRRSTVFKCFDNPIVVNGMEVIIIKEQYIPSGRRFTETEIIQHIHKDGTVPGVVQMIFKEDVMWKGWDGFPAAQIKIPFKGEAGKTYNKIRIGQCDMGVSILNTRTPRELLIGIYDLLAVTRYLYSERHVLHRDISPGNVMCILEESKSEALDDEKSEEPTISDNDTTEDPSIPYNRQTEVQAISLFKLASARYLLGEVTNPMALSCTLIDFDHGEILGVKPDVHRTERTGTPVFISRAVNRSGPFHVSPYTAGFRFIGMPEAPYLERYRKTHGDRVELFPKSGIVDVPNKELESDKVWRHELRHDAESVFWLIIFWIMHARPENGVDYPILPIVWALLTNKNHNYRDTLMRILLDDEDEEQVIHPGYKPLQELIQALWIHIQHDHHYVKSHNEYVHEAFQRCILSFLHKHRDPKNKDSEFMTLIKDETNRVLPKEEPKRYPYRTQPVVEKHRYQTSNRKNAITAYNSYPSQSNASESSSPSSSTPPVIPELPFASNGGEKKTSMTMSGSKPTSPPQSSRMTRSQSLTMQGFDGNCPHGSKRGARDSAADDHLANDIPKASKKARHT